MDVIQGKRGLAKIFVVAVVGLIAVRRVYILTGPFMESVIPRLGVVAVAFIAIVFVGMNTVRLLHRLWKS